jgi:hypothetical protein
LLGILPVQQCPYSSLFALFGILFNLLEISVLGCTGIRDIFTGIHVQLEDRTNI